MRAGVRYRLWLGICQPKGLKPTRRPNKKRYIHAMQIFIIITMVIIMAIIMAVIIIVIVIVITTIMESITTIIIIISIVMV